MKRWDAAIVAAGVVAGVIGAVVVEGGSDRYIAAVALAGLVLTAVTFNHLVPRSPRVVVTYANPQAADRPVVWNDPSRRNRAAHLVVRVENRGRAPARAVEVEFDHLGMHTFNASGNPPDPRELDVRVSLPRFMGGKRVLNPGDSPWKIVGLSVTSESHVWRSRPAHWVARAEGMKEQRGAVEITLLEGSPEKARG
jgi:hypothetical protein